MDPISLFVINHVVDNLSGWILPVMVIGFTFAVLIRGLIFYLSKAENRFAYEFDKRAMEYFIRNGGEKDKSFHKVLRHLLSQTYYDTFEKRRRFKRRHFDHVTSVADRLLGIEEGIERFCQDILSRTRFYRRSMSDPKMLELTKYSFERNPYFNKLFGTGTSIQLLNELISILPGLLIIGGIFGTFLGIARGIPELGSMDLSNADESKKIMDAFLVHISQAMIKSIIGIGLSVIMSLVNTVLAPEMVYYSMINRFTATLEKIWNETETNAVDVDEPIFEMPEDDPSPRVDLKTPPLTKGGDPEAPPSDEDGPSFKMTG